MQAGSKLIYLVPTSCLVCGGNWSGMRSLCGDCERELPWLEHACHHCGIKLEETLSTQNYCGSCLLNPPAVSACFGLFRYRSPIDKLIGSFKFNANFQAGHTLSQLLAIRAEHHYRHRQQVELILPVPLHRNRLRQRGFNQALEIAKLVSRQCRIPLSKSALLKVRETTPQTELGSARARKTNLTGAFNIGDLSALKSVKSVALIDDVVTTMTTVNTLARLLKRHGIRTVDVWCLARASR